MKKKKKVLMCCSELGVKGGMVSVVKNYLGYSDWKDYEIIYVPTHTEKSKIIVAFYFLHAYIKIFFLALGGDIKIAHLHTAERGSFFRKSILVRTLRLFGIKTVMHHHAAEFEEFYESLSQNKKQYVNKTLELADLNIVLSKRLVSMITDKAPNAKVEVLYNAVDTYTQNPYNVEASNVLFLGRLGNRKGTYDLLRAFKSVEHRIPKNTMLYLCGDGDIEGIRAEVNKLALDNRVAHIGWIDSEKKKEYMHNSAINVLPSYNEGLPMSILETMAYGLPNISTNIASIPEVIENNHNGFLVNPGDLAGLSKALVELLNHSEQRRLFSERSYSLILSKFSLDKHIERLLELYDSLVEE